MDDSAPPAAIDPRGVRKPRLSGFGQDRMDLLVAAAVLDPPVTLQGRCRLDDYEIVRVLGEGGMGVVLLAEDPAQRFARRHVAIKLMSERLRGDPRWVQQFLSEANHMLRLHHQRILPVLWVSREKLYYVTPYVRTSATEGRRQGTGRDAERARDIALQVAAALRYAHEEGQTTHRDIKPDNVLVDCFGRAFLTDFGLGRRVDRNPSQVDPGQDVLIGSAPYMPPEALEGKADSRDWDIYSFGALLYEMLTGRAPYDGPTDADIFAQIRSGPPVPLRRAVRRVDRALAVVVERCMARRPADRFRSMAEVEQALMTPPDAPHRARRALGFAITCSLAALAALLAATASNDRRDDSTSTSPDSASSANAVTLAFETKSRASAEPSDPAPPATLTVMSETPASVDSDAATEPTAERTTVEEPAVVTATESTKPDASDGPPRTLIDGIGQRLVFVPPGTFTMGSAVDEPDRDEDETAHRVQITHGFYIGHTEVTMAQWRQVMGTKPWQGRAGVREEPNAPAVYINWNMAVAFCRELSRREGHTYRLPTEAEWEYTCRAGSEGPYGFDATVQLARYAWYRGNTHDRGHRFAHRGAWLRPNAWGIHDMHGNVEEWCADFQVLYPFSAQVDPRGPSRGPDRVLRGGSWRDGVAALRSANRFAARPDTASDTIGFRVVRNLDGP